MCKTFDQMMAKTLTELELTVEREVCNNNHRKLYLKNKNGEKKLLVLARSPSDSRAALNMRADLRRFSKQGNP
jgi:hypothetical protein